MADRKPIVLDAFGHPAALPSTDRVLLNNSGLVFGAGLVQMLVGSGSPEGVVTAPVGSVYTQINGTAGKTLWVKESGVAAIGWASSDPWTYVKSTVVQNSTAIAAAATVLTFTPAANTSYEFEVMGVVQSTVATTGPRLGIDWPTGTITRQAATVSAALSDTASAIRNYGTKTAGQLAASTGVTAINTDYLVTAYGILQTGAAPTGSLTVTLASEIAASQVSLMPGSFIKYRKI